MRTLRRIRNILGGTFRQPIICQNVPRLVPGWAKPIVLGRHAFGGQHRATDLKFPGAGKLTLKFVGKNGEVIERDVFDAPESGVVMAMINLDKSVIDFAPAGSWNCSSRSMRLNLKTGSKPPASPMNTV